LQPVDFIDESCLARLMLCSKAPALNRTGTFLITFQFGEFIMIKSLSPRILLATALVTVLTALAPASVMAREGSVRSIGGGIKCYNTSILNPDGTVTYTRICFKSA
jgi:hypothetical protein